MPLNPLRKKYTFEYDLIVVLAKLFVGNIRIRFVGFQESIVFIRYFRDQYPIPFERIALTCSVARSVNYKIIKYSMNQFI